MPTTPRPIYASEMTYFKKYFSYVTHIQTTKGRTIRKVILSISEHPNHFIRMKWEGLYVALSRVRFRDDVRLLLKRGDRSTMDYIVHLNKNALIKNFFNGYLPCLHPVQRLGGNIDQLLPLIWDRDLAARDAGFVQNSND